MTLGRGVDLARKSLPPVGAMRQVVYHSDQEGKGVKLGRNPALTRTPRIHTPTRVDKPDGYSARTSVYNCLAQTSNNASDRGGREARPSRVQFVAQRFNWQNGKDTSSQSATLCAAQLENVGRLGSCQHEQPSDKRYPTPPLTVISVAASMKHAARKLLDTNTPGQANYLA
ncbi:hypothetical protein PGTUg99_034547 [Puccinia graminis f. sp. tritici]|uniref:Uncharacterized protein n=1 Tax=Puccinia graminis f. sp. tritici TaxID=56615 RepID=A0A5B0MHQ9_PUCGR|nr:hypothetical protein PGTUg99_034547 [Puccinia graminis f. sp. tritici]